MVVVVVAVVEVAVAADINSQSCIRLSPSLWCQTKATSQNKLASCVGTTVKWGFMNLNPGFNVSILLLLFKMIAVRVNRGPNRRKAERKQPKERKEIFICIQMDILLIQSLHYFLGCMQVKYSFYICLTQQCSLTLNGGNWKDNGQVLLGIIR